VAATDLEIRPLTTELWPALEDLFGPAGASNGCWCMYWRLGPAYRRRPRQANRDDLRELAAAPVAPGLVALAGDRAVGWCALAPRAELHWLARARSLQPVDDRPVWSLPCFYVRRGHRGQGVMDALIAGAVAGLIPGAAAALEAYPVDTAVAGHTRNLFPGTAAAFARHGFAEVARRAPDRPIMRRLGG
jgi:GNAT superfamily N-acetyltransferase